MTDKKFEIKNLLDKKNKKLKFNWIISLVLALFALVILFITIQNSIKKAQSFFDNNVVRFNRVVEIKVNSPFKVISKEEVKREESLDKKAEEISNKCVDDYLLSLTPTPKQKSGLIKPVQAKEPQEADISNIVSFIKWRESNNCKATNTGALNVYCQNLGKSNCYGYNPSKKQCFENEEIAKAVVTQRVSDLIEEFGNIPQALCRYNGGTPLTDCQYYQDYLKFSLK